MDYLRSIAERLKDRFLSHVPSTTHASPAELDGARWHLYLSNEQGIDHARLLDDGRYGRLSRVIIRQKGQAMTGIGGVGPGLMGVREYGGAAVTHSLKPVPFQELLLGSDPHHGGLWTIPLDETGRPEQAQATDFQGLAASVVAVESQSCLYVGNWEGNRVERLDLGGPGLQTTASYRAAGSLPRVAYDPVHQWLWVAEDRLTRFNLRVDPGLTSPIVVSSADSHQNVFVASEGRKLLAERKIDVEDSILSERTYELYDISGPQPVVLRRTFAIKPYPNVAGLSQDGRWLFTGGNNVDRHVRCYKVEGAEVTMVGKLLVNDITDGLDVHPGFLLARLRTGVALITVSPEGSLALAGLLPGTSATMMRR